MDLGLQKNYKTKVIIDRWEQERAKWLEQPATKDPRDGLQAALLPMDHKQKLPDHSMSVRRSIKQTMRSVQSPYPAFSCYYPLDEVIDTYMEIWYQSDSSDSSS